MKIANLTRSPNEILHMIFTSVWKHFVNEDILILLDALALLELCDVGTIDHHENFEGRDSSRSWSGQEIFPEEIKCELGLQEID